MKIESDKSDVVLLDNTMEGTPLQKLMEKRKTKKRKTLSAKQRKQKKLFHVPKENQKQVLETLKSLIFNM
jgi:hypothetical protein